MITDLPKYGIKAEPMEKYLALSDHLQSSDVPAMAIPKKWKFEKENKAEKEEEGEEAKKEKKSLFFGTLLHTLSIEPNNYEKEYGLARKFDGRKNEDKAALAEWLQINKGKKPVEPTVYANSQTALKNVLAHKAFQTLRSAATPELSHYIKSKELGVPCKFRPDLLNVEAGYMVSVKTTKSPETDGWPKEVINFNYHIKEAFYQILLNECYGGKITEFYWFVIGNCAPFDCGLYQMPEELLSIGREWVRYYAATYKECLETNNWWGLEKFATEQGILPFETPTWIKQVPFINL